MQTSDSGSSLTGTPANEHALLREGDPLVGSAGSEPCWALLLRESTSRSRMSAWNAAPAGCKMLASAEASTLCAAPHLAAGNRHEHALFCFVRAWRARARIRALLLCQLQLRDISDRDVPSAAPRTVCGMCVFAKMSIRVLGPCSTTQFLARTASLWQSLARGSPSAFQPLAAGVAPVLVTQLQLADDTAFQQSMSRNGFRSVFRRMCFVMHGQEPKDRLVEQLLWHYTNMSAHVKELASKDGANFAWIVAAQLPGLRRRMASAAAFDFDSFACFLGTYANFWCESARHAEAVGFLAALEAAVADDRSVDSKSSTAPKQPVQSRRTQSPRVRSHGRGQSPSREAVHGASLDDSSGFCFADDLHTPKAMHTWRTVDLSGNRDAVFTFAGVDPPGKRRRPGRRSKAAATGPKHEREPHLGELLQDSAYLREMLRSQLPTTTDDALASSTRASDGSSRQLPVTVAASSLARRGEVFAAAFASRRRAPSAAGSRPISATTRNRTPGGLWLNLASEGEQATGGAESRPSSVLTPAPPGSPRPGAASRGASAAGTSARNDDPRQTPAGGASVRVPLQCFLTPSAARALTVPSSSSMRARKEQLKADRTGMRQPQKPTTEEAPKPPTLAARMFETAEDRVRLKTQGLHWQSASVIKRRR